VKQLDALETVDTSLDLKPYDFALRQCDHDRMAKSVVEPGYKKVLSREVNVNLPKDIDYDCDKIRAMIKLFTTDHDWTVDQFRLTLGHGKDAFMRNELTRFLELKGPQAGLDHPIYQAAWMFFREARIARPVQNIKFTCGLGRRSFHGE
jgi:hypothetical protein